MQKRYVLYSSSEQCEVASCPPSLTTNWDMCVICQQCTKEKLQCPAESKRNDCGAGYQSFAEIIVKFPDTQQIISRLDEGDGMCAALTAHCAKWHKSCRSFFCSRELDRAARRPRSADIGESPMSSTAVSSPKRKCTRAQVTGLHVGNLGNESPNAQVCFLCGGPAGCDKLHAVSTLALGERVCECAQKLEDFQLLALLAAGDLVAQEAKYHAGCLKSLYNRARSLERKSQVSDVSAVEEIHGIVFAQLVSYIDDAKSDNSISPVFKLSDLTRLYSERLGQLDVSDTVHSTRLKQRLLAHYSDMRDQEDGRDILLIFDTDIGPAVHKACDYDLQEDGLCLSRAAQIVRKHIFSETAVFDGMFNTACQEQAVPKSLLALISMILEGPNIADQTRLPVVPAAAQLSQLLVFNSVKHKRQPASNPPSLSKASRHSKKQETPLPLYIGLLLHATTRKKSLVNKFAKLGLSVSYDRVLSFSSEVASAACTVYKAHNAVVPSTLDTGLFTVGAVDNIDHNPSSTTAHGSFHGTGISLMQTTDVDSSGCGHNRLAIHNAGTDKLSVSLPKVYTTVCPAVGIAKQPCIPAANEQSFTGGGLALPAAIDQQHGWLHTTRLAVEDVSVDKSISWSAYHAQNVALVQSNTRTVMLPLFRDSANSFAMIRHSMDIVKTAVNFLNPNQTPVITADQPLYALAKQIQWSLPDKYGEDKFVVMLGGFHVELAALRALGCLLKSSGWVEVLVDAGIATAGTAESFLSVSHVRRCRHVHEVTMAALHSLEHRAYDSYQEECCGIDLLPFDQWCSRQTALYPQFAYWHNVKEFELYLLLFVYSLRTSDFPLYVDSLTQLIPWFFALDRTHYARWLSVHIRDMAQLPLRNKDVHDQFMSGKFTSKKSSAPFSAVAFDQAHEQLNKIIKGDGGIVGLTENDRSLSQLLITAPEMARLINEFEAGMGDKHCGKVHHEQTPAAQSSYLTEVKQLVTAISNLGNPFIDDSGHLTALHTKDLAASNLSATVGNLYCTGKSQYDTFIAERFCARSVSIWQPLKRNSLAPFASRPPQSSSCKTKVANLKTDCALFSRLYIACQTREGNLDDFFQHENHSFPPSLSVNGELHFGTKSDLLRCLEKLVAASDAITLASAAYIIDGAAVVQMLQPASAKTFSQYAERVFAPYIQSHLDSVSRVDIVWDKYDCNSLKATARKHRGAGMRRHVTALTPIPKNWHSFLAVGANKTELFDYLSEYLQHMSVATGKQLVITSGINVHCVPQHAQQHDLSQCSHEEADTRVILHAYDAAQTGFNVVVIRTVDTDVVVLALANYSRISCGELWIAFGTGQQFRYIPVHRIATILGQDKCTALPAFHAITGCDTTSCFVGRGKKSAWNTWLSFPEATVAFAELTAPPSSVTDRCFAVIEKFVILLYDRTNFSGSVNSARKQLFCSKGRTLENIPPTRDALLQHVKRAAYQAGHVWGQALVASPSLPCPSEWGWELSDGCWKPIAIVDDSSGSCTQLRRVNEMWLQDWLCNQTLQMRTCESPMHKSVCM